jgi:hypothetical protein
MGMMFLMGVFESFVKLWTWQNWFWRHTLDIAADLSFFSPPSEYKSCISMSMEGIRIDIIAHWLGEVHICPLVLKFGMYLIMSRHFSSHKRKWIMQKTWVRKDARQKQAFPSTVSIRLFENFCPVVWILWTWMWILTRHVVSVSSGDFRALSGWLSFLGGW